MSILDTSVFVECFIGWAAHLAEKAKKTVAIDGKSMRVTKNKVSKLGPIHIVNVWCCENQLALWQQIVSGKSNEITAIPLCNSDRRRHGLSSRTRYLWKEAEIEATIQYVVHEQGLPMAVFENKNRTFNTTI